MDVPLISANAILIFLYDAGESDFLVDGKGCSGSNAKKVKKAHLGHNESQKCNCKTRTVRT